MTNLKQPPLNGFAVQTLEEALRKSPNKTIRLIVNNAYYQLSREGNWFKFGLLSKKRSVKRAAIFDSLTELYNQVMHGHDWQIATAL